MSLIMDVLKKNKPGESQQEDRAEKVMEKASKILSSPTGASAVPPALARISKDGRCRSFASPEDRQAQDDTRSKVQNDRNRKAASNHIRTIGLVAVASLVAILLLYHLGISPWGKTNTPPKLQLTAGVPSKTTASVTADPGAPKIVLEGVILGDEKPLCVIKGQILKVGDSFEGNVIKSINSAGVRIIDETGKSTFIKLS